MTEEEDMLNGVVPNKRSRITKPALVLPLSDVSAPHLTYTNCALNIYPFQCEHLDYNRRGDADNSDETASSLAPDLYECVLTTPKYIKFTAFGFYGRFLEQTPGVSPVELTLVQPASIRPFLCISNSPDSIKENATVDTENSRIIIHDVATVEKIIADAITRAIYAACGYNMYYEDGEGREHKFNGSSLWGMPNVKVTLTKDSFTIEHTAFESTACTILGGGEHRKIWTLPYIDGALGFPKYQPRGAQYIYGYPEYIYSLENEFLHGYRDNRPEWLKDFERTGIQTRLSATELVTETDAHYQTNTGGYLTDFTVFPRPFNIIANKATTEIFSFLPWIKIRTSALMRQDNLRKARDSISTSGDMIWGPDNIYDFNIPIITHIVNPRDISSLPTYFYMLDTRRMICEVKQTQPVINNRPVNLAATEGLTPDKVWEGTIFTYTWKNLHVSDVINFD